MALSPTKVDIPSRATQTEIDNDLAGIDVPPGSSIFNETTEKIETSLNGGVGATWTQNTVSDANDITIEGITFATPVNIISEGGPFFTASALQVYNDGFLAAPRLVLAAGRGTKASPTPLQTGDLVGGMSFAGVSLAGTLFASVEVNVTVDGTVTATETPMNYTVTAKNDDTTTQSLMQLNSNGKTIMQNVGAGSEFKIEAPTTVLDSEGIDITGDNINFTGNVVSSTYSPKFTMRVIADEAIPANAILTASNVAFRVRQVLAGDPDSVPVIGFSLTASASPGDEITISGAAVETVQMDAIDSCSPGDPIEKSDITTGRVQSTAASVGTFGIAAESAVPNQIFKIWVRRSEQF